MEFTDRVKKAAMWESLPSGAPFACHPSLPFSVAGGHGPCGAMPVENRGRVRGWRYANSPFSEELALAVGPFSADPLGASAPLIFEC
jgi:hypothetical protein